jgi:hypothetical protein
MIKYLIILVALAGCSTPDPPNKEAVPLGAPMMFTCEKQLKLILICFPEPTKAMA